MAGLAGVHEKGWRAGGGQGRGDLAPDVATLAHAHHDDATAAHQHDLARAPEAFALARLQAEQGAGLDVESVARELQRTHRIESGKGSVGRHGRHVASSRINRF